MGPYYIYYYIYYYRVCMCTHTCSIYYTVAESIQGPTSIFKFIYLYYGLWTNLHIIE